MHRPLALLTVAFLVSCADTPGTAGTAGPPAQPDYVTGSHLPRRTSSLPDPADTVKGQDLETLRDAWARDQARPAPPR